NDILEVLTYLLSDSGYEIEALSSGEEIFETISRFRPDLILMDVMLAGMDGRDICRQLKENIATHRLPVILISASHDLTQTIYHHGAPDDFVPKPFDIDHLLSKIKRQLVA
ncbi:PleD family two-component system response regulator, partial [Mucilaginibacter sp.]|uniref:response regulator n=1 Tax=Mucilaginibacter sp. TaxID=1882438 RepID=UPI002A222F05|nr:response regulator [Mucilaginibacter sp.]